MQNGCDEQNFGRGCRSGFAASGTRLTPNISREHSFEDSKLYVGDVGTEDTKYLSTTGAEYGCRGEAFTLAEVLITLSIIGVVAALTIPSLIVKNQEKETVSRLKKAYSTFSNAFMLATSQYGTVDQWELSAPLNDDGTINPDSALKAGRIYTQYLNIVKNCENKMGCLPKEPYRRLDGILPDWSNFNERGEMYKVILADGTSLALNIDNEKCTGRRGTSEALKNSCGGLFVDLNGLKAPNIFGKDAFIFYITKNAIIPEGTREDTSNSLVNRCKYWGYNCTAWVLFKENIDYETASKGWD